MIDHDKLRAHLESRLPKALSALQTMVDINSFTHHAEGVNKVGDVTAALFGELGLVAHRPQAIECVSTPQSPMGKHLFLHHPQAGSVRIGLVGHLDTVYTEADESENDFHYRQEGNRIYGPGTFDMKGGNVLIWMILDAIQALSPDLFARADFRVMFNAAEEGLSSDFGSLIRNLMRGARACLVYEAGTYESDTCYCVNHRKGSAGFRAVATGRAAHAGSRHERGANALVQLSEVVLKLHALTDYSKDLTCNVGVMRGGTVTNQVPDRAEAFIGMRAYDPQILQAGVDAILALDGYSTITSAADGYAASVEVSCRSRNNAWPINDGTEGLLQILRKIGQMMGLQVEGRGRGGLSDGNFLWDIVPTVDGMGPEGENGHCAVRNADGSADQEYVLPGSFVRRAMLSVLAIEKLVG